MTQLTADYQNQFSTAQNSRGADFAKTQTARRTKFQEAFDSYSVSLREEAAASSKQRESLLQTQQEDLAQIYKGLSNQG